jgi:hypothetical protein
VEEDLLSRHEEDVGSDVVLIHPTLLTTYDHDSTVRLHANSKTNKVKQ